MAVLDRSDLEASSLADLHSVAGQIGLDGFRRLRKAELVEQILSRTGGDSDGGSAGAAPDDDGSASASSSSSRRRRGGRRGGRASDAPADDDAEEAPDQAESEKDEEDRGARTTRTRSRRSASRSGARSTRSRAASDADERSTRSSRAASGDADMDEESAGDEDDDKRGRFDREQAVAEGEVEVLGNGSAFLRLSPLEPSENDVYISAAQVRRCELVSGDRVSGPVRRPRRSERYPSLARVDSINGETADASARTVKYDSLPARFPSEALQLDSEDATVRAIGELAPIGRGSRVSIVGASRSGKTETLRRLLDALCKIDGIECTLLLLGARPEELHDWQEGPLAPAVALTFAASADAQGQGLEQAIESAKRIASRGGHALLAIDSLDGVHPHVARRALAAAKSIDGAGSLTIVATASKPFGGESTLIALDVEKASTGRLPAIDLMHSSTLRAELLVGQDAAERIVKARAALSGG